MANLNVATEFTANVSGGTDQVIKLGESFSKLSASFDTASGGLDAVRAAVDAAGGSFNAQEAITNRLHQATLNMEASSLKLSNAQAELEANTNPAKQAQLELAVAGAQVELDKQKQTVTALADELEGELNPAVEEASETMQGNTLSLTDLKSGLDMAGQALQEIKKAYDATVGAAAEWGDTMGDLAQLTGASVRDTSLMAATFELMGVEIGTLESALKAMTKNGLQLNLDTLKKLAAQYQAIQDPVEQNEFLFKNFGKAGLEMAEIMGRSADELDKLGAAAARSGKVIDEQAAQAAEDFNVQMEIFQQNTEGAAISLGTALIPWLNKAIDGGENWVKVMGAINLVIQKQTGIIDEDQAALRAAALAAGDIAAVYTEQFDPAVMNTTDAIDRQNERLTALNASVTTTTPNIAAMEAATARWNGVAEQWKADEAEEKQRLLNDAVGAFNAITGQSVENELAAYQQKQKDIGAQIADTKGKLDELGKTPHLTEAQRAEMAELKEKYDGLKSTYAEEAEAHKLRTRTIILGFIEQKLAMDGLTEDEMGYLLELGEAWGVYGDDTKKIWDATVGSIKDGMLDVDETMRTLGAQFPSYFPPITQRVNVEVSGAPYGAEPGGEAPVDYGNGGNETVPASGGYASGGSFIVPPGYPNDSYRIGVQSGERVTVETPAQQRGGLGGNVSISVDARGAVDPRAVEEAGYRGAQRALAEVGMKADTRRRI